MSMSPPPDLARKVGQLDSDVGAIYNMLNAIQATQLRHGNRLDEISRDLGGLHDDIAAVRTDVGTILELLRAN